MKLTKKNSSKKVSWILKDIYFQIEFQRASKICKRIDRIRTIELIEQKRDCPFWYRLYYLVVADRSKVEISS